MIKTMKRSLVLAAAVAAMSAIAVPSMASAANWGVVGSTHTLSSTNLFLDVAAGQAGAVCNVNMGATVRNPASSTLDIVSSTHLFCPGRSGYLAGCTVIGAPSNLPWTATAVSTTNIQMYVKYTVTASGSCLNPGTYTLVGTVSGAWTGNGVNQHSLQFTNASGLTFGWQSAKLSGTVTDLQQTLTLL